MKSNGVQLLSILLTVSVSVGMSLGFNLSTWWIGVASGVATGVGLALFIRYASNDGVLVRLSKWIIRE